MENSRIEELLEESIRATARTTHAVRALVRPSYILLISLLIAIPLVVLFWLLFLWSPNDLLPVLGLIAGGGTLIGGIVLAISSFIDEFRKSELPKPETADSVESSLEKTKKYLGF